ncbi:MAG: hypothetical protein CV045_08440 [Cyanobacteria bacterium M5B4]|nr:MAG: hypothetical protein CV045_08440 [Cyanobacteria bacterium M5B4]
MPYKLIEELAELITALAKLYSYKNLSSSQEKSLRKSTKEEIADVKAQIELFEEMQGLKGDIDIEERMQQKYNYYKQLWQKSNVKNI